MAICEGDLFFHEAVVLNCLVEGCVGDFEVDVRTNITQANSIQAKSMQGSRQPFALRFKGMTVALCGPIPSEKLTGYELRLVIDKAGAEKFKPFASKYHQNDGQIEVPLSASYEYDGDPKTAYRVLVGDQRVYKGSPLEKLFRHLVKAMPVDERIKKFIIGCLEKTQSFKAEEAPVESLPSLEPGPPVMPLKTAFPSPPPKPPVVQPAPMVSLPLAPVQSANPGGGITQTFFLKDPQHPQAPPVKMSVSVSLGPVTVVTR